MRFHHHHDPHLPLMQLYLGLANGGGHDPEGLGGATHLGLEWLLRSHRDLGKQALHMRLDQRGTALSTHVSPYETWISLSTLAEYWEETLSLLQACLVDPNFSPKFFKECHSEFAHDQRASMDNPSAVAEQTLRRVLFDRHPRRQATDGEFTPGFDPGMPGVKARLRDVLVGQNLRWASSGLMPVESAEAAFESLCVSLPEEPAPPPLHDAHEPETEGLWLVPMPQAHHATIRIAAQPQLRTARDRVEVWIEAWALGGTTAAPLVQELREARGLAYDVGTGYRLQTGRQSPISLSASLSPKDCAEFLDYVLSRGPCGSAMVTPEHRSHAQGYLAAALKTWAAEPQYRLQARLGAMDAPVALGEAEKELGAPPLAEPPEALRGATNQCVVVAPPDTIADLHKLHPSSRVIEAGIPLSTWDRHSSKRQIETRVD